MATCHTPTYYQQALSFPLHYGQILTAIVANDAKYAQLCASYHSYGKCENGYYCNFQHIDFISPKRSFLLQQIESNFEIIENTLLEFVDLTTKPTKSNIIESKTEPKTVMKIPPVSAKKAKPLPLPKSKKKAKHKKRKNNFANNLSGAFDRKEKQKLSSHKSEKSVKKSKIKHLNWKDNKKKCLKIIEKARKFKRKKASETPMQSFLANDYVFHKNSQPNFDCFVLFIVAVMLHALKMKNDDIVIWFESILICFEGKKIGNGFVIVDFIHHRLQEEYKTFKKIWKVPKKQSNWNYGDYIYEIPILEDVDSD